MNYVDIVWVLILIVLVMLMILVIGFFYGGMVRRKNFFFIIIMLVLILGFISIEWVLIGYSMVFGFDKFGLIGGFEWVGLKNVGYKFNFDYVGSILYFLFMVF